MLPEEPVDILVIGGGINGTGIACDAAGRGLKVVLCEQGDLAQATSSASTKLIHGGLRYLEHFEFRLVHEALQEREVLLAKAPHIIWPLRFVLPHDSHLRPAWLIRLGLFLYDHLGRRSRLPGSHGVALDRDPVGEPLRPEFRRGFVYSDCWVEDSRLVVLNAMAAAEHGAHIRTRTRCVSAQRGNDDLWTATLLDGRTGRQQEVRARALVNAAGPWVDQVLTDALPYSPPSHTRLVKGSHIVVRRLFDGDQAYILQNDDKRIIFAIPYEGEYTLIGTTDLAFTGDPASVAISPAEIDYLCGIIGKWFKRPVAAADVVWSYAGVRPLYDDHSSDASAVTRDYVLELDDHHGSHPVLSVFGGKITTYRRLAEHALDKLKPFLPAMGKPWTHAAPLPGGDLPDGSFEGYLATLGRCYPWLPPALARRYARAYGSRTERLLAGATSMDGLGQAFGDGIYEAELTYLATAEWALCAEDVLYRRSKLALHTAAPTRAAVAAWFDRHATVAVTPDCAS